MKDLTIYGEMGGGKGGGGSQPIEEENTLFFTQTVRLLFAISEGEIDSVEDVLVNNTSVRDYVEFNPTSGVSYKTVDMSLAPLAYKAWYPFNPVVKKAPSKFADLNPTANSFEAYGFTLTTDAKIVTSLKYTGTGVSSDAASNVCSSLPSGAVVLDSAGATYRIVHVKGTDNKAYTLAYPYTPEVNQLPSGGSQVLSSPTIKIDSRVGSATQDYIKGFSDIITPSAGSFPIKLNAGNNNSIYTFQGSTTSIIVTLMTDRLMKVDKGNRVAHFLEGEVLVAGTDGNFQPAYTFHKEGKCTSPYYWSWKITKPAGVSESATWSIMARRVSEDITTDDTYDDLYLANVQQVIDKTLTYPRTALLSVELTDPEQFGGSIPDVKFKLRGIKLPMPSNYTVTNRFTPTETRTYLDPWDGTFSPEYSYTDNPAWILYWLLCEHPYTDAKDDWGLRIPPSEIDVGAFYNLAKHCDEVVPYTLNGVSLTEFRYTAHLSLYEREDIPTALMKILTLCNANFTTNEFGQISVVWDAPGQQVSKIISNSNVIEGAFSYSSTDLESRTTVVNVTYNRDDFNGEADTVTVEEPALIARYGYQTSDIVLLGCKSEAQARRKARWALYTNCYCTEMVTFKQLFQGATYHIGELIQIQDSDALTIEPKHGVVTEVIANGDGSHTVKFDRPLKPENSNGTFRFYISAADPVKDEPFLIRQPTVVTIEKTGLPTGMGQLVHTFEAGKVPMAGTTFTLTTTEAPAKLYKVVKVEKDDDGVYTIVGSLHQEGKYAYIDTGIALTTPSLFSGFSPYTNGNVDPVTNITIAEVYAIEKDLPIINLEVSWEWENSSTNAMIPEFRVIVKRGGIEVFRDLNVREQSITVRNVIPGVYDVSIRAVNPRTGKKSNYTKLNNYDFRTAEGESTLLPPTVVVKGTNGLVFDQPDLELTLGFPTANNSKKDKLKDYRVDILTLTGELKATYRFSPNVSKGGDFRFPLAANISIFGTPTRSFKVKAYSRDRVNDISLPVEVTVSNLAPVEQNFIVTNSNVTATLKVLTAKEHDFKGYLVWRGTTSGFVKDENSLVYRGDSNPINVHIPTDDTYYYAIAAFDSFGETGLNISTPDVAITGKSASAISLTAEEAKADAVESKAILADIAKDYKIVQGEKSKLFREWKDIYDEYPAILSQAQTVGVSTTNYTAMYNALASYLTNAPLYMDAMPTSGITWCSDPTTFDLGSATNASVFRGKFSSYYIVRTTILNAVASKAKEAGDNAQTTANSATVTASNAQQIADTAQTTANSASSAAAAAQADATAARTELNEIASDAKITKGEKSRVFLKWKNVYLERADIVAKATAAGVSTTSYTDGYNTLANYLTGSPISIPADPTNAVTEDSWVTNSSTISIVGMNFRMSFATYYSRRQELLNAIAAKAQDTANAANSSAMAANNNANSRMLASATNVLSGSGTVQVGNMTNGVVFSSNGLLGRKNNVTTFSIDTTGTAVFAGSLTGATGWMGDLYIDGGELRNSKIISGVTNGFHVENNTSTSTSIGFGQWTSETPSSGIFHQGFTATTKAVFKDSSTFAKFAMGTYAGEFSGNVYVNGSFTATGNVTAYSDRRLKTNLKQIEGALDKLEQLTGYYFNWKEDGRADLGVIADEMEKVIPEGVFNHETGYQTVDYSRVIPLLIEAIKELRAEVRALK